jgi:hypothetical protein
MREETDEVVVNYFLLCDQVIVDAQTGKHSIIGIYSGIATNRLPVQINIAVALSGRVQTATQRELSLRISAPDGTQVLATPPLKYDWNIVHTALQSCPYATVQLGIQLRGVNLAMPGVYTAAMYCDGSILAIYPLQVALAPGLAGAPGFSD